MSEKLSPALLDALEIPRWRLRAPFRQRSRSLAQSDPLPPAGSETDETAASDMPSGAVFFVPEDLTEAEEALLENIRRVFPGLRQRYAFSELARWMDRQEAGGHLPCCCFGSPPGALTVAGMVRLPSLAEMLAEPVQKKRCYLALMNLFGDGTA